jgi:hypothetical protein
MTTTRRPTPRLAELAKDVAALANHVGEVIVIAVREEELRAVELAPVSLADNPTGRHQQILLRRITPHVRDVNILIIRARKGES